MGFSVGVQFSWKHVGLWKIFLLVWMPCFTLVGYTKAHIAARKRLIVVHVLIEDVEVLIFFRKEIHSWNPINLLISHKYDTKV